jgi:hypothetical protein
MSTNILEEHVSPGVEAQKIELLIITAMRSL